MNLVRVERFFNGSKMIFYFTADSRVDFRGLVKDLVQEFRTRVEMRQVGVRHETKMIGGIGTCGRELCCSSFIKNFDSVSIKMAKEQDLPLNPTKISGVCNRLLCCLTYEYETYRKQRKNMPKAGKQIQDRQRGIPGQAADIRCRNRIIAENSAGEEVVAHQTGLESVPAGEERGQSTRNGRRRAANDDSARSDRTGEACRLRFASNSLMNSHDNLYHHADLLCQCQPHLGHAYTTIVADTYSRFRRLCGDDGPFSDRAPTNMATKSSRRRKTRISRRGNMSTGSAPSSGRPGRCSHIQPDHFIRTTDADHVATVQDILQKVYDRGDIYFNEYSGLYCRGCERYLTEKELVDGNCPDHLTPPQEIAEQNYFFRMSRYQERLIDHIQNNPEFITPERYRNEVLSFLSEPLEDLCISRPKSRLTWGIRAAF